jgi:hypothetical protein
VTLYCPALFFSTTTDSTPICQVILYYYDFQWQWTSLAPRHRTSLNYRISDIDTPIKLIHTLEDKLEEVQAEDAADPTFKGEEGFGWDWEKETDALNTDGVDDEGGEDDAT